MALIHVKAADGVKMPKEHQPRNYITGPETVEGTHYYVKAVQDGDLVEMSQAEMDAVNAARLQAEQDATAAAEKATKKAAK